jgi:hypothetical protein
LDNILIIFDQNKTDVTTITRHMNSFHQNLEFTPTLDEHNSINHLDLSSHKGPHNLQLGIYRKPTQTDTTIHFTSTHPLRKNWQPTIFTSIRYCLYRSCTTQNSMIGM